MIMFTTQLDRARFSNSHNMHNTWATQYNMISIVSSNEFVIDVEILYMWERFNIVKIIGCKYVYNAWWVILQILFDLRKEWNPSSVTVYASQCSLLVSLWTRAHNCPVSVSTQVGPWVIFRRIPLINILYNINKI